jgi:hypothetical protein
MGTLDWTIPCRATSRSNWARSCSEFSSDLIPAVGGGAYRGQKYLKTISSVSRPWARSC